MADEYDRTLLRLSTLDDPKLPPVLDKLLPIVLGQLPTSTAEVRPRLVKILNHISMRAKSNTEIGLPVSKILDRWLNLSKEEATAPTAPLFFNLAMVYTELGAPRVPDARALALQILKNFDQFCQQSSARPGFFLMVIQGLIPSQDQPPKPDEMEELVDLISISKQFYACCNELFLIPCAAAEAPSVQGIGSHDWTAWKRRLTGKDQGQVVELKKRVLKLLSALKLDPNEVYVPMMIATTDQIDQVSNAAEIYLRMRETLVDLENSELVAKIFTCALLKNPEQGGPSPLPIAVPTGRMTVPAALRLKVLKVLDRSLRAADAAHAVLQLIRESLDGTGQVVIMGLQLCAHVSKHASDATLEVVATTLLDILQDGFIASAFGELDERMSSAFRAYGALARRHAARGGSVTQTHLDGADMLFASLRDQRDASSATATLDALRGVAKCCANAADKSRIVSILDKQVMSRSAAVRKEILGWAEVIWPAGAPERRYYPMKLMGDALLKEMAATLVFQKDESPPDYITMASFLGRRAFQEPPTGVDGVSQDPLESVGHNLRSNFSAQNAADACRLLLWILNGDLVVDGGDDSEQVAKKRKANPSGLFSDAGVVASRDESSLAVLVSLLDHVVLGADAQNSSKETLAAVDLHLRGWDVLLNRGESQGQYMLQAAAASDQAELSAESAQTLVSLARLRAGIWENRVLFRQGGSEELHGLRTRSAILLASVASSYGEQSADSSWRNDRFNKMLSRAKKSDPEDGSIVALGCFLAQRKAIDWSDSSEMEALNLLATRVRTSGISRRALCHSLQALGDVAIAGKLPFALGKIGEETTDTTLAGLVSAAVQHGAPNVVDDWESNGIFAAAWRLIGAIGGGHEELHEECSQRIFHHQKSVLTELQQCGLGLALLVTFRDESTRLVLILRLAELATKVLKTEGYPVKGDHKVSPEDQRARGYALVWLVMALKQARPGDLDESVLTDLCGVLARCVGGISMLVSDCSLKGVVHLYRLADQNTKPEILKVIVGSFNERFGEIRAERLAAAEEGSKITSQYDSVKKALQERVDTIRELLFISRELDFTPFLLILLDQPAAVWSGAIFKEALDLQNPCLPKQIFPEGFLPKLTPLFFYYNGHVRDMILNFCQDVYGIENALVLAKDPYWPSVRSHLVKKALVSTRAYLREAAIRGATQLFRSQAWPDVEPVFSELWYRYMALLDDGEPRTQAVIEPFGRAIRSLTVAFCDPSGLDPKQAEISKNAVSVVLPFLMQMLNTYQYSRQVCVSIIMNIVSINVQQQADFTFRDIGIQQSSTKLGQNLIPYLPDLIPLMLESLHALEHSDVGLLQSQLLRDAGEEASQRLEQMRVNASGHGAGAQILDKLVPLIDAAALSDLAPKLKSLMSGGVGANTRAGVCKLWAKIAHERPSDLSRAVVKDALNSMCRALLDSSVPVRKEAAYSFAVLGRISNADDLNTVVKKHLVKEGSQNDAATSRALVEVVVKCGDRLDPEIKDQVAVQAFIQKQADKAEDWENAWEQICPSRSRGIRDLIEPICAEISRCFAEESDRGLKLIACKAIQEIVDVINSEATPPSDAAIAKRENALSQLKASLHETMRKLSFYEGSAPFGVAITNLTKVCGVAPEDLALVERFIKGKSAGDRQMAFESIKVLITESKGKIRLSASTWMEYATNTLTYLNDQDEQGLGKVCSPQETCFEALIACWEELVLVVPDPEMTTLASEFVGTAMTSLETASPSLRVTIVRALQRVIQHAGTNFCPDVGWQIVAERMRLSTLEQHKRLRRSALDLAVVLARKSSPAAKDALLALEASCGWPAELIHSEREEMLTALLEPY